MAELPALRNYLRNIIGLGNDAVGLERANAVINEGIESIEDLAELEADDGVKTMTANIRKPGGTIPDPAWVDPGGGAVAPQVNRPGQSFPTICEQRMILATYGAYIYASIGREINADNLQRARLREFKVHREMVDNHTEPSDMEKVSKSFLFFCPILLPMSGE